MSNEELFESLDNGVLYYHNFLFDKFEIDREEGNNEWVFDAVQRLGLKAAYKYYETGEYHYEYVARFSFLCKKLAFFSLSVSIISRKSRRLFCILAIS